MAHLYALHLLLSLVVSVCSSATDQLCLEPGGIDQLMDVDPSLQKDCEERLSETKELLHKLSVDPDTPPEIKAVLPGCINLHEQCTYWAVKGYCETNGLWMRTNCAPACFACWDQLELSIDPGVDQLVDVDPSLQKDCEKRFNETKSYLQKLTVDPDTPNELRVVLPGCRNLDERCTHLAVEGYCQTNSLWMHSNCAPACFTCLDQLKLSLYPGANQLMDVDASLQEACEEHSNETKSYLQKMTVAPEMPSEMKALLPACRNLHEQCTRWAVEGYCDDDPLWMHSNCAPACFTCLKQTRLSLDPGVDQWFDDDPSLEKDCEERFNTTKEYLQKLIMDPDTPPKVRADLPECRNRNEQCTYWAVLGECKNNRDYMQEDCAPACFMCHTDKHWPIEPPFEHLRVSDEFSLFPEIALIQDPRDFDVNTRLKWMKRRFRRNPIFGLIENKLLSHSLLNSMGIPQAIIYYGAFSTKAMGEWPKFDRKDFIKTLAEIPAVAEDHHFIMKPASGLGANDILVMNDVRWVEYGWTLEKLADLAEELVDMTGIGFTTGQRYAHDGLLIQENIIPKSSSNVYFQHSTFDEILHYSEKALFELKVTVVFGRLTTAVVYPVPINYHAYMDLRFCGGIPEEPVRGQVDGELVDQLDLFDIFQPMLTTNLAQIKEMASQIADACAADWFRLDMFIDDSGMLLVNEVTYPSQLTFWEEGCEVPWYVAAYKHPDLQVVSSASILQNLLGQINVTTKHFLGSADYLDSPDHVHDDVCWEGDCYKSFAYKNGSKTEADAVREAKEYEATRDPAAALRRQLKRKHMLLQGDNDPLEDEQ